MFAVQKMCLVTCCIVCSAEDVFGHILLCLQCRRCVWSHTFMFALQKMCLVTNCIVCSAEDVFGHMLYSL